jgi:hypothetical protein
MAAVQPGALALGPNVTNKTKGSTAWVSQFARLCSFWVVLGGTLCQVVGDALADREDFLPKGTERRGISPHASLIF